MRNTSAFAQEVLITGEEMSRLADLGPCELIDGRIVPMTPTSGDHGWIEGNTYRALDGFVRPRRLGKVLVGEVGIFTQRNPDRVRAADVLFISSERYARRQDPSGYLDVPPELVVEILSPGDSLMEAMQKIREYCAIGVKMVWIVDPQSRTVYVFRSVTDMREVRGTDRLPGDHILPEFDVPVAALFEE
jgi:Uma2 family endonuclease